MCFASRMWNYVNRLDITHDQRRLIHSIKKIVFYFVQWFHCIDLPFFYLAESQMLKLPVAPFSVRAFCTISSSSGPLKVHFVWEALSVFCSACTKWCGNWLVFLEKVIFRLCFHAILTENYVKFNIVWNRLCPHNMCHRIKIGKRKRGLRGIFIIIFVQNLSKSVRI